MEMIALRAFFTMNITEHKGGIAMRHTQDNLKPASRLLDLRFNYIPAAATDIAATWKRFGFDPHANKQRREQLRNSITGPAAALIAS